MSPARRGRTRQGRARAKARRRVLEVWQRGEKGHPLLKSTDHGDPIRLSHVDVQALSPDQWIEPFLAANRPQLERLRLEPETSVSRDGVELRLHPQDRIGAMPLLSPSTRKVVAGLLVEPRFGWASVGRVLGHVGFRVEPDVGGAPLVPGSAREVPPWVLAGPVLSRVAALVQHLDRTFVESAEERESPRGTVDWNHYARRSVPRGQWQRFLCRFPDLSEDPWLMATLRWTLRSLAVDLEPAADTAVGRGLLERAHGLLRLLGAGAEQRPRSEELQRALGDPFSGAFLGLALEAVGWIRDERGLGGTRTLDGLAWRLATDRLWEAWVESLFADLARRMGARFESAREGGTRRPLVWRTPLRSLGHLAPDIALHLGDRTIWIDAKYKAHFLELHQRGWNAMAESLRDAHRADIHQALAYASLSDAVSVDTWLVYPVRPQAAAEPESMPTSIAEITSGNRRVRLFLAGLPFGFEADGTGDAVSSWERILREAA